MNTLTQPAGDCGRIRCYELNLKDGFRQKIVMNVGATILTAMEIGFQPALVVWEPEHGISGCRHFRLLASNESINLATWKNLKYLGTAYIPEVYIIVHIMEETIR